MAASAWTSSPVDVDAHRASSESAKLAERQLGATNQVTLSLSFNGADASPWIPGGASS